MYNHHWKTYLRRNCLETKKTNFLADVAYARPTLKQADLARLIGEEGCEIREETILDIIGRYESMIRRMLLEGHCVLTPNYRMMPRVPAGIPPGKYKVTIRTRFTPGGKCMQKELQETSSTFPLLVAEEEQT